MIIIKKLKWSNAFSYGANNEIDFSEHPLLQLVGKNGHGKTSIALILEEGLYNKNSKGIKKAEVLNRYVKDKHYSIEIHFSKDGDEYVVETRRGSTQTVKLSCNEVDISAHTSTATYKMIEDIIGMDHKAFSQIVFQSSASSLEFLTATDTKRKEFLIDLLQLSKYVEAGEIFKAELKASNLKIATGTSKLDTLNSMIAKNRAINTDIKQLEQVPVLDSSVPEEILELKTQLANLEANNRDIIQNNKYKELYESIKVEPVGVEPEDNTAELADQKSQITRSVSDAEAFVKKMKALGTKCPTCLENIDSAKIHNLVCERMTIIEDGANLLSALSTKISEVKKERDVWKVKATSALNYEKYYGLYDPSKRSEVYDAKAITSRIIELENIVREVQRESRLASERNSLVLAHNAKVELVKSQLVELEAEVKPLSVALAEDNLRAGYLQVLVKAFSTTGLTAYKIECLVKDLEDSTNEYLNDISDGRFQLSFQITSSDKLNVVINDNGKDIDILALSGGERARVNIATLLGIRKLLQGLSKNRINLLFLDETIENLDAEGKDKLIEILAQEVHLNTVLVSHGFQHPLVEKQLILKTNNISRIE